MSTLAKIAAIFVAFVMVTILLLVVMSSGIFYAWRWGELDALFGLSRPLTHFNVVAILAVYEVWKVPAMIEVAAKRYLAA